MKLSVRYFGSVPDANVVWYIAKLTSPEACLQALARRIMLVGKELLGEDLHRVDVDYESSAIEICLTKGISKGPKRFDFRSFLGWVKIFNLETGLAIRASMPRVN